MPYLATESRRSSGWHYFHLSSFGAFYSSFVLIWNFRHFHLLQSWNRTNQFSLWCTGCSLTPQWLTGGSILIFKLCHFHLDLLGQMLHHHQWCYCISDLSSAASMKLGLHSSSQCGITNSSSLSVSQSWLSSKVKKHCVSRLK